MDAAPAVSGSPSQDERVMAALSHGAIILSWVGMLVPLIIWITQKDKSRWVAYQALQAIAFQAVRMVGTFFWGACYMAAVFSTVFTTIDSPRTSSPLPMMAVPFGFLGLLGLFSFLFLAYAVAGVVMTAMGRDFHYIFIGDLIAGYMKPPASDQR